MVAGIKIFKKTQIDTVRQDFFFFQVGYKLFQNVLAALYIVYRLLLFILYEMHLVELCCSKSATL